ncbi:MAG: LysR substrate-binding domain-containing protein [Hyphomicrobiaceae bacterium]
MRDLNDLYFFVQAVDHGGFAPAARSLGMPKSRLSRRIAVLEDRLGVRLVQRTTRRFAVTEIGQEYYRHCVAMLVEANAADEAIARIRSEPQGLVKVSCPSALIYFQVGDMIGRFMAANPRVEIHLECTNRRVDVIAEGFDLALRARLPPLEDSELIMKVLGNSRHRLLASPELLKRHTEPLVPADLAGLPSVDVGPPPGEHFWSLDGPDGSHARIRHHPRLIVDDMVALCFAARNGVGVAELPTMMIGREIENGGLVDVLPDWSPKSRVVHAVFPSRRGLLPSVRALLDHLAAEYATLEAGKDGGK